MKISNDPSRWGNAPSVHVVKLLGNLIGPIIWDPPTSEQTYLQDDRQTRPKTLPFRKLRMQTVKMYKSHDLEDVSESELHVLYTMFVTYSSCNCSHYQSPRTVIPSSTTHFVSLICKQKADKLVWAVNLWHKQVLIATVVCRLLTNHSMECLI